MRKVNTAETKRSKVFYDELEDYLRQRIQEFIQDLLEEEVTEFFSCNMILPLTDGLRTQKALRIQRRVGHTS